MNRALTNFIVATLWVFCILFSTTCTYAQELFAVKKNALDAAQLSALTSAPTKAATTKLSFTKKSDGEWEDIPVAMTSRTDTQFVLVNPDNGNNVVFTPPADTTNGEFRIAPFLIEELKQSTLGTAESYLLLETDKANNLRSSRTIAAPTEPVYVPTFYYGDASNMQEATPDKRNLVRIDKQVAHYTPASPFDEESVRELERLAEENSYYVYTLEAPDGTRYLYNTALSPALNAVTTTIGSRLKFKVSFVGEMTAAQRNAVEEAFRIWGNALESNVTINAKVSFLQTARDNYIGQCTSSMGPSSVGNFVLHSSLYNHLQGKRMTGDGADFTMVFNPLMNFYYGNGTIKSDQFDLVTIALHEITHGLGFGAYLNKHGSTYTLGSGLLSGMYISPGIFTKFLTVKSGGTYEPLSVIEGKRSAAFKSDSLYFSGKHTKGAKLFAPHEYTASSVCHWDAKYNYGTSKWETAFPTFMGPVGILGMVHRSIDSCTLGVMHDIGWVPPLLVTFDKNTTNNWTGKMEPQSFSTNVKQALTKNDYWQDKYLFSGWNTKADGTGKHYDGTANNYYDEEEIEISADLKLYAQWVTAYCAPAGSGTEADPYQITSLCNLTWINDNCNVSLGKHYKQMTDINAAPTRSWNNGAGFTPIGTATVPFRGNYNGDGKKITGLYINTTNSGGVGLFGNANSATLRNLEISGADISGTAGAMGTLLGNGSDTTINNCSASGKVTGSGWHLGGLAGSCHTILNSHSSVAVTVSTTQQTHLYHGGLVGYVWTVSNCYATGKVISTCVSGAWSHSVGGLAGHVIVSIDSSHAFGDVVSADSTSPSVTGGLSGTANNVTNCSAQGSVTCNSGSATAGGLIGGIGGDVLNCRASGAVTVSAWGGHGSVRGGGLVGEKGGGKVSKSFATGRVTGYHINKGGWGDPKLYLGGLISETNPLSYHPATTVVDCYATGSVYGDCRNSAASQAYEHSYATSCLGGLVGGSNRCNISRSYARGHVVGIIGANTQNIAIGSNGTTMNDFNSNRSLSAGGLVGRGGTISNSYVSNSVRGYYTYRDNYPTRSTANLYIGGLSGSDSTITGSYSNNSGGSSGTPSGAYELQSSSLDSEGKTPEELRDPRTYVGWDFESDWRISPDVNDGFPYLFPEDYKHYVLTYHANNGSGETAKQYFMKDVEQSLDAEVFVQAAGNRIIAWNTKADGSGTSVPLTQSYVLTSDMTLYAQRVAPHTVTFNTNSGTGGTMANQVFPVGETLPLTANAFTRTGYTYNGWNTKADGSGQSYSDAQQISAEANMTLYAQWLQNRTVTFNSNSGSGTMSAQTFANDVEQYLSLNTFTRSGYIFIGWNTSANGSGIGYAVRQKLSVTANTTLYAQWKQCTTPAGTGTQANPYKIASLGNLLWAGANVSTSTGKFYTQINDIDAAETHTWVSGLGMPAIGNSSVKFSGNYNGGGYQITNLLVHQVTAGDAYVGLFGYTSGATIANLRLSDSVVAATLTATGKSVYAGSLAGYAATTTITNCSSTSEVGGFTGTNLYLGNLIGYFLSGTVTDCFSFGNVSVIASEGSSLVNVGGLIGLSATGGVTSECFAAGTVDCNATGASSTVRIGGLIGAADGAVSNCFSSVDVMGKSTLYADVGSLIGMVGVSVGPVISNCYAVGNADRLVNGVAGGGGGLIGYMPRGTAQNCYWDTEFSGNSTSAGGVGVQGKTSAQMKVQTTYSGWSFADCWSIAADINAGYPYLSTQNLVVVKYMSNGGTGSMPNQTLNYGLQDTLSKNLFSRSGHVFLGWDTKPESTEVRYFDQQYVRLTGQEMTLYAKWGAPCTVTFHGNGATNTMASQAFVSGVGDFLNICELVRAGYTFVGWNTKADGSGTDYLNGQSLLITENITLYAQWNALYTVTFNTNGGSGTMTPQIFPQGMEQELNANTFKRTGYTFAGWTLSATNTGTVYANQALFTATANTPLYAKWTPDTYQVSFNSNGGSGTMTSQTFTRDVSQALKANTFVCTGDSFLNWNTKLDGMGTTYTDKQVIAVTADTVLYARWVANVALATALDNTSLVWSTTGNAVWAAQTQVSNFGGSSARSGAITHNQSSVLSATVRGPGTLSFDWRVSSEANADILNFSIDGVEMTKRSGTGGAWASASYAIALGEHSVTWKYAKNNSGSAGEDAAYVDRVVFTPTTYTVSFNNNGGAGTMAGQTFTHDVAQALSANTFTRTGYSFSNWNTVAAGTGISYTDKKSIPVTANMTLYARWVANVSLAAALDNVNLSWSTTGNANWFGQTVVSQDGVDAAKSGAITHNQSSTLSTTVTGPGTLSFYWRVSSEANSDILNVSIDGAEKQKTSGTAGNWVAQVFGVTSGQHTFTWKYAKDGAGSAGEDAAYVDQVVFTPETYTVTFDKNGGTGTMAAQTFTAGVGQALSVNRFARAGYTCAGWTPNADGTGKRYSDMESITATATMTLYARWIANISLATALDNSVLAWTASGDSGWVGQTVVSQDGIDAARSGSIADNQSSVMSTTVLGPGSLSFYWRVSSEANADILNFSIDGSEKTKISGTADNWKLQTYGIAAGQHTLTWKYAKNASGIAGEDAAFVDQAVFAPTTYTLTFDRNNGSGTMGPQTFTANVAQELSRNTFVRTGYTFAGWTPNADGTGTRYSDMQSLTLTAALTLHARWVENVSLAKALDNSSLTWATSGNAPWVGQAVVANYGGSAAKSGAIAHGQSSTVSTTVLGPGTVSFYWRVSSEANADLLNFSIDDSEKYKISGTTGNWSLQTFGIAAGQHTLSWKYAKNASGTVGEDAGYVDQVVFTPTTYTVTFDKNGGTGTMDSQTFTANVAQALSVNRFARAGYTCAGWTPNADGTGKRYSDMESITATADMTLYARWVANVSLATALDNAVLAWSTSGDAGWVGQTVVSQDAVDAARSGSIADNQSSVMSTTVTGPGTLSFYWRVSSEANADILNFSIDGSEKSKISGIAANWNLQTYGIAAGQHTLTWKYTKNTSAIAGEDAAFIDKVVYAPTYTVTFSNNGGAGTMASQTFAGGVEQALNANTFTRTGGYTFVGWNTSANGTGKSYSDKESITASANMTLYARWLGAPQTVTFLANGGDGYMWSQAFNTGTAQGLTPSHLSRTGYDFAGWNTAENGSGTAYADAQVITISAPLTLYAQWSIKTITVEYFANSGTGTMAAQTFKYGVAQALRSNVFVRNGYVFKEWNTEPDGSQVVYSDAQSVALTRNLKLYAQWTPNTYTVTFDANGGAGTMAAQTFVHAAQQALSANLFTRADYLFKEWNTAADAMGLAYSDKQTTAITANTALFAIWRLAPTLAVALDNDTTTWTTSGDKQWFAQEEIFHYDGAAAQSGAIAHGQESTLSCTVTGPGSLSFYWRVSSEADWDLLRFFIDDKELKAISGTNRDYWSQELYGLNAGEHTLTWSYTKDGDGSAGADTGYVDKVVFVPNSDAGAVSVTILGIPGVQWRIASLTPWTNSGTKVQNLPIGTYTVEFSAVTGYDTPPSEQVTITKEQTATLAVDYRRATIETNEMSRYEE